MIAKTESDWLGRTTKVTEDEGGGKINRITEYDYDSYGNRWKLIAKANPSLGPASDQTTEYTYGIDGANNPRSYARLVKVKYPRDANDVVKFEYDRIGRQTKKTDQRLVEITYTRDNAGRLTQATADTSSIAANQNFLGTKNIRYTYDHAGRRTKAEDDNGQAGPDYDFSEVTYAYDGYSALTSEVQKLWWAGDSAHKSRTVSYHFQSDGRIDYMTYPYNSTRFDHDTDPVGRLKSITRNSNTYKIATFEYWGYMEVKRKLDWANGSLNAFVRRTYLNANEDAVSKWDAFGRVTSQVWEYIDDLTAADTVMATHVDLDYAYTKIGNPKYQDDQVYAAHSALYYDAKTSGSVAYDNLDRLKEFFRGTLNGNLDGVTENDPTTEEYDLDVLGNWDNWYHGTDLSRTTEVRTHDGANQLTARTNPSVTLSFDRAGNLIDDGTYEYHYDMRNRLTKVERKSDSAEVGRFYYDGANRRGRQVISNSSNGGTNLNGTKDFVYSSSWQIIETRAPSDGQDSYGCQVVYGLYVDEPIYLDDLQAPNAVYLATDRRYNVVARFDAGTGGIDERYEYSPYGRTTIWNADYSTQRKVPYNGDNLWRYGGQPAIEFDPDGSGYPTVLYDSKNRIYDPVTGRWPQRDPAGYVDGMDLYQYAGSSPVSLGDSTGLDSEACTGKNRLRERVRQPLSSAIVEALLEKFGALGKLLALGRFVWKDKVASIKMGHIRFINCGAPHYTQFGFLHLCREHCLYKCKELWGTLTVRFGARAYVQYNWKKRNVYTCKKRWRFCGMKCHKSVCQDVLVDGQERDIPRDSVLMEQLAPTKKEFEEAFDRGWVKMDPELLKEWKARLDKVRPVPMAPR